LVAAVGDGEHFTGVEMNPKEKNGPENLEES